MNVLHLRRPFAAMIAATALAFGPTISAKEGMFTPDQLQEIEQDLRNTGLQMDPKELRDLTQFPMGAVVSLGGCSASFVSPKGLVITNHHCVRGSIQFNSNETNNYLENGFLAKTLSEELPAAPGSRVYVTEQVNDVTDQVMNGVSSKLSGVDRYQKIEENRKALIAKCEQEAGYRCQVSSFFGGAQYKLNKRLEIKDVRLVHAPSDAIGRYGGDIDNWIWPRHTGDYAFYRAYVSPTGESAEFSEDNVPYQPKHTLRVSAKGIQEGDFVMVAGYPGSTSRYERLAQVKNTFDWSYPTWITLLENWINTIEANSTEGSDERIKYESRLARLNNFMKNLGGQIDGARRVGLVEKRAEREAELKSWISKKKRDEDYATAITKLDALTEEAAAAQRKAFWYTNVKRPALLNAARQLYRLSIERQKEDADRESGYQERDLAFIKQSLQRIDRRFAPKIDKAEWLVFIEGYMAQNQRVKAFDDFMNLGAEFDADKIAAKLETFYANTKLNDVDTRLALMQASSAELEESTDPFMQLAVALFDEDMAQEKASKDRQGRFALLKPSYMRAITAWQQSKGYTAYPDANSNLRVTYGNVMGGSPRDGLRYTPFTTLQGILEKDTGISPFNSPQTQLDLINRVEYGDYELKSLDSVPVNFLADLDITGGNSGSATLNGKGELVGLVFDGTLESVNSDWYFDADVTRSIHVDSRYMLWVMEKVDNAQHIIDEMEIVR